jgi:hypothetical protein
MIRITTWRQTGNTPDDASPVAAVAAFNEVAEALGKVSGAGDVHWGFGNGGVVTVGTPSNYAVADAVLKDAGVQAAVIKVFALGFVIAEDYFVSDAQQVMPFLPAQ